MDSEIVYPENDIPLEFLYSRNTEILLNKFDVRNGKELNSGLILDFEITDRKSNHKICPILVFAKEENTKDIIEVYQDVYNGTYPYKEMLDEIETKKMIANPNLKTLLFKDNKNFIAGCVTFVLDFQQKRGYIRGFMLKKAYHGKIDVTKGFLGAMIVMYSLYKKDIMMWYVENRTAHSKSQYPMYLCGISPIAFFPNKDIFFNEVESDLMQIIYNKKVLRELRSQKQVKIIPEVSNIFTYANYRYNLGIVEIDNPSIELDHEKITYLSKIIKKHIEIDKFGYHNIKLTLPNTNSYFQFLYTPSVKNFEKTKYKTKNLEELVVFLNAFKKIGRVYGIRYYEVFVSAYKSEHQRLFYDFGFSSRGYIPSWKYNAKKGTFDDSIVFNFYEGKISKNIKLIEEAQKLIDFLEINK